MQVISSEIIRVIGGQLEPSRQSLDSKQQLVLKEICSDITSKELAAIQAVESTKKIQELSNLCIQLPEGMNVDKATIVDVIVKLVKLS